MKNDSKSGLCIRQIISTSITIIIISFSMALFANKNNNTQMATLNEQEQNYSLNTTYNEVQLAQEREIKAISRTAEERNIAGYTYEEESQMEIATEEQKQEELQEDVIETENYISIEEITISRDMNLTQRCGISKEDFKILMENLKTDYSGFFAENSEIIYELCEKYEINEIFLCGLVAAESGWNIASNHRNTNNYISMMSGGRLIKYASVEEGLEAATKLLHNKYLTEGGSCYYGKTLSCVQKKFCPNSSTWVGLVYGCMSQVVK